MVSKVLKYFLLLIFLWELPVSAQNIEVYAGTDTSQYLVGDYIHYTIEVTHTPEINVIPPFFPDSLKKIELIEVLNPVRKENESKLVDNFSFVLAVYDSSDIIIPPVPIYYTSAGDTTRQVLNTDEVKITVRTLDVNMSGDIQDVKRPLYIEFNWLFMIIIGLIIIVLSVLGYLIYKRFKKKRESNYPEKRVVLIPPYQIALKALSELEEKKLWQQGKVKEYHSEITGIIRKYYEDIYGFLALEMTSSEILENLRKRSDSIYEITGEFLSNADLVKFAKFIPLPSINEIMLKQAYEIVNKTKPGEKAETEEKVEYA